MRRPLKRRPPETERSLGKNPVINTRELCESQQLISANLKGNPGSSKGSRAKKRNEPHGMCCCALSTNIWNNQFGIGMLPLWKALSATHDRCWCVDLGHQSDLATWSWVFVWLGVLPMSKVSAVLWNLLLLPCLESKIFCAGNCV